MASGSYGVASPNPLGCVDINYCVGNPCSANGACSDAGEGVVDKGGYTCACNPGYEVKLKDDGSETCSADDCAGAPCGNGGTCTDLSSRGGAPGQYKCECEAGYELDASDANAPKCKRVICGPVPNQVANVMLDNDNNPDVTAQTWKGDDARVDSLTSMPILMSYDVGVLLL